MGMRGSGGVRALWGEGSVAAEAAGAGGGRTSGGEEETDDKHGGAKGPSGVREGVRLKARGGILREG